ncbi:Uncharacterized protein APZ42_033552 [Daphnia magna]|uniref:Uncharacterized protein n=1 Tax=Daphnia magna TaxID=35525 RepID=A0A164KZJ9_9CRUS|nr:Uncharacterized protein APZ42_033552 [Daphnia magna]
MTDMKVVHNQEMAKTASFIHELSTDC